MRQMQRAQPLALLLVFAGCGTPAREAGANGWRASAPLATAQDLDPTPRIVEVNLTADETMWTFAPGRAIEGNAYNGTVPGPTIEARVGDTLVVHFTNRLSEPTTIHWHGVRVPIEMDGGPHSQAPVPPGGTFEYRFTLPDAGTFWYHPHANEPEQMERGLYGAIVVRGDEEPIVDAESVVMLDDLLLDDSGALAPFGSQLEVHGGREGDVQLVNGTLTPNITVRPGERQRWRIVNAGSARIYQLAMHGRAMTVIGSDGGLWEAPETVTSLIVAPGDRFDVLVEMDTEMDELVAQVYARGHGQGVFTEAHLLHLLPTPQPVLPALPPYVSTTRIEHLDDMAIAPREVTFDEVTDASGTRFFVNGETFPDVTPIDSRVGQVQVWDLVNRSEMTHPFHLHGFFFQVLSRNGVETTSRTWEDTFEFHGEDHVRIAFRPDDRPGMWMFHCHILEHVHAGMMGMVDVAR